MNVISKYVCMFLSLFIFTGCQNLLEDPLTDEGVFYQIFVRAFADSDGDGIGDLNGITENLDYLEGLGISGIWLLPIHPSPSYHGYDVTDYYGINPEYGTIEDFENLVDEANKRGIKVIIDLVVNHTSSEHPWFKEALEDPESEYVDYFVFADRDDTSYDFSASPIDGIAWHSAGDRKYFGAFWGGMPDWNASNQDVRDEFIEIGEYWIDLGVNGFRLDAAKYMYATGEYNTELILLDENIDFWNEVTGAWREHEEDLYIVSEVWSDAGSVAPYYEPFDANFNFDLASEIISVVSGGRDPYGRGIYANLMWDYEKFAEFSLDGTYQDAIFLSNHDQNRVMSVLGNDEANMKLASEIYMMLPGNPYIYYGEELGMLGMKPDEDIRLPFKWGTDYETTWRVDSMNGELETVLEQFDDADSLLNHYKELIALRDASPALSSGEMMPLTLSKSFMIGQIRYTEDEAVVVLHNVSDFECYIDLVVGEEDFTVMYQSHDFTITSDNLLTMEPKSTLVFNIDVDKMSDFEDEIYFEINN